MKKTVSVVYAIFVVAILLGVIAYFGWETYQSRAERIVDFDSRTEEYTSRLTDSLTENRNVNNEVAIAEKLMQNDPSLIAVQVYSHDDGLRLSVVKPRAGDYSRKPLAESGEFDGFFARLRYHTVTRPMRVKDMTGLEVVYVSATLSGGEIRNNLLIILITVVALFIITLVLILVRPGRGTPAIDEHVEDEEEFPEFTPAPMTETVSDEEFTFDSEENFDLPESDSVPALSTDLDFDDDNFSESIDFDDDFSLPDFDDLPPAESVPATAETGSPLISRLESELERAASFNQDLSLILFKSDETATKMIRESFNYEDLLFDLGDGRIAVIEINKDLDTALAFAEDFIRNLINQLGNRRTRAGIASRSGRLIGAERLFTEALGALNRTDDEKNIVAFRSDPEKYREYLRSQQA